jgi:hypothetical protein
LGFLQDYFKGKDDSYKVKLFWISYNYW